MLIEPTGNRGGYTVLAFFAGAAAGALVALLTAPHSGAKLRARIRGYADDAKGKVGRVPEAVSAATSAAKSAFESTLGAPHGRH
jgi:gas vesicle protein